MRAVDCGVQCQGQGLSQGLDILQGLNNRRLRLVQKPFVGSHNRDLVDNLLLGDYLGRVGEERSKPGRMGVSVV